MEGFLVNIDLISMSVKIIAGDDVINPIISEEKLYEFFRLNGIRRGFNKQEIKRAFKELPNLTTNKIYIVAEGKKPINGKDGEIVFKTDISERARYVGCKDDENGSIDYKSSIGISTVAEGDCICVITPPTRGIDGYDTGGKLIPAANGKPAKLILGSGVEFSPDGTKVYSLIKGRPLYSNRKLTVSPIYEIFGDVCYETGNVNFDGHVYISGSVADDFTVEARSIEIRGCVGNSKIKCSEDLLIAGGINGRSCGDIFCQGNATIKYINDAKITISPSVRRSSIAISCV